jgi:putative transposase
MKYRFISNNSDTFPVGKMAKVFNIHRSNYYRWLRSSNTREQKNNEEQELVNEIKEIQDKSRFSYGTPRVTDALKNKNLVVNHKKVARLLRGNGLNHRMKRKFRITTDSNHNFKSSPNFLNRDFDATAPNKKWVSDITYIWTAEGWLYLCVIIDLFSRKVIGWSVSSRIDADLLLRAFWNAVQQRNPGKGLIFHSDRGSQYCSIRFRNALKSRGMIQSMSRRGNCWDNACAETFFKSLKSEWIYDVNFKHRQEAKNVLFEYIEIFYNRKRSHSFLDYNTPEEFELKRAA